MSVIIDTNVISDVIHADPKWLSWSTQQIASHFGQLVINPIIFGELCCRAGSVKELETILEPFDLKYQELPKEALFLASQAFLKYRKRGGTKSAPLPDFFIGAHAEALGLPILTRDTARFGTYFERVQLITP
ncbi:MAG: type II toxin-antitoxin system VapC family toxin [Verrucomicrobiota bacterium]